MTEPLRIVLTGKLRSGKSEAANQLWYKHGFKELAFGDQLKRVADELFDGTEVEEYASELIYRGDTDIPFLSDDDIVGYRKPRRRYQDFGQAMRQLDPNVWIRQVERSMSVWENMRYVKGIVVSDARQPNEIEWARNNVFTIIRVTADDETRLQRAQEAGDNFTMEDLGHETEQHIDSFSVDYDVINDGTVDELRRKIDAIVSELLYDGKDEFNIVK